MVAKAGDCSDESKIRKVDKFNEEYRMKETGDVINWFEIEQPEGYFCINDKLGDIMSTMKGKIFLGKMMMKFMKGSGDKGGAPKAAGFEVSEDMMKMMNGFTVKRILSMLGTAGMDVKLTKEDMLQINAELNKIKKK